MILSFDFLFFIGKFQVRVEKTGHFEYSTADKAVPEVTSGRLAFADGLMGFTEMLKKISHVPYVVFLAHRHCAKTVR